MEFDTSLSSETDLEFVVRTKSGPCSELQSRALINELAMFVIFSRNSENFVWASNSTRHMLFCGTTSVNFLMPVTPEISRRKESLSRTNCLISVFCLFSVFFVALSSIFWVSYSDSKSSTCLSNEIPRSVPLPGLLLQQATVIQVQ